MANETLVPDPFPEFDPHEASYSLSDLSNLDVTPIGYDGASLDEVMVTSEVVQDDLHSMGGTIATCTSECETKCWQGDSACGSCKPECQ